MHHKDKYSDILKSLFSLLAVMYTFSMPLVAQEIPTLIVLDLPGLTAPAKTGSYGNVFDALADKGLIKPWSATPVRRAHKVFFNKQVACMAPSSAQLINELSYNIVDYVISKPFNNAKSILYFSTIRATDKKEKPILGDVGFGEIHGVDKSKYQVIDVGSHDRLIELIFQNRIDVAYIIYPDILAVPNAQQVLDSHTGEKVTVWDGVDAIICHKEYASQIKLISTTIYQWEESGKLKALLGKYYFKD